MFTKKTIRDVDVKGRTILLRADYNVPLAAISAGEAAEGAVDAHEVMQITSDLRIRAGLPTIEYLLEHEVGKIIIISHLGRPDGQCNTQLSLQVVAEKLAELLVGVTVNFVDDVSGPEVEMAVESLPEGGILLLENLRFSPEEKANSADFAREIVDSTGAELFVQDGFAVTHRAHASTVAIAELLPSVAGLLVEQEVNALTEVISSPEHPFVVIIGGAKVADKEPLIAKFSQLADRILVGGKIAADGYQSDNPKIYVAEDFDTNEAGDKLDIGPVSTMHMVEAIQGAKTVLWNGVLGKVEDPAYATSSAIIAKTLGENRDLNSVICGGDTSGFVEGLEATDGDLKYTLVSTGGGAALNLLLGQPMPGIDALADKSS